MIDALQTLQWALGVVTIPVLAAAAGWSIWRARSSERTARPSVASLVCMGFVLVLVVSGVVAGVVAGIPLQISLPTAVVLVLASVLLRRDEQYWAAQALLLVLYTAVGAVSVLAGAHNYEANSGGWRGVRLLVAWGGPGANPTGPHWEAAVVCLSIMRYGLPLATTVALSWVLATRREMGHLERVALLLVSGTFLGEVMVGATLSAITFSVGAISGLPLTLALGGVVASLLMLFTVGPGAVTGIVVGVKWLATVRQVGNANALVTTLRGVRDEALGPQGEIAMSTPMFTSLMRFLRGQVGWIQKLNVVAIVGVFLLMSVLALTFRLSGGSSERVEVAYQYLDREIPVDGRVTRTLYAADGQVWISTDKNKLLAFDPDGKQFTTVVADVADVRSLNNRVYAVTSGSTSALLLIDGIDAITPVSGLAIGPEPTVALTSERAYVAGMDGSLVALGLDGSIQRRLKVDPIRAVLSRGPELYTVHDNPSPTRASFGYVRVRRHPATLAEIGREEVGYDETGQALVWLNSDTAYSTRHGSFYPSKTVTQDVTPFSIGDYGRLGLDVAGERRRFDFSYDSVLGYFPTKAHGTWLVVDDHIGIALTPRQEPASYVVRWPGAPKTS